MNKPKRNIKISNLEAMRAMLAGVEARWCGYVTIATIGEGRREHQLDRRPAGAAGDLESWVREHIRESTRGMYKSKLRVRHWADGGVALKSLTLRLVRPHLKGQRVAAALPASEKATSAGPEESSTSARPAASALAITDGLRDPRGPVERGKGGAGAANHQLPGGCVGCRGWKRSASQAETQTADLKRRLDRSESQREKLAALLEASQQDVRRLNSENKKLLKENSDYSGAISVYRHRLGDD